MGTYKEVQNYINAKYSFNVETCWIAHVKEINGLIDINIDRQKPCPSDKIKPIQEALLYFGILS